MQRARRLHLVATALFLTIVLVAPASAVTLSFNGSADNPTDEFGYYYAITGGKFPTGTTPNGDNGSGGTFRYIHDDTSAWGAKGFQSWARDDWFPENAGLAMTLKNGSTTVYDNNGIEDSSHGGFYDYSALPEGSPASDYPGLYRGFSMPNTFDWIYATYFKLETETTFDTIMGYFDPTAGFDPTDPQVGYVVNIWTSVADGMYLMPSVNSFVGDAFSSLNSGGSFATSDAGVDRVFPSWLSGGISDDIYRLTYTADDAITLPAGEYFFSHSAVIQPVPEPGTLLLLATGLVGLASVSRRRRNN